MKMSIGRTALGITVLGAVLLFLGSTGQEEGGFWEDGPAWLGAIGWFGFLICVLLLACTGVWAVVSRVRHHGGTVTH